MLLVGIPYTESALATTRAGGTPYGASHVAHEQNQTRLTGDEARIAEHLGKRVADIAVRLSARHGS
jgi:NAD(P)H dehydrogenase (quinone)